MKIKPTSYLRHEGDRIEIAGVGVTLKDGRYHIEITNDHFNTGDKTFSKAADCTDDERLMCHVRNQMTDDEDVRNFDRWRTDPAFRLRTFTYSFRAFVPVEVGMVLDIHINQGPRECEVIKINRTRLRVAYEMPNAGDMEGWQPVFKHAGVAYIELHTHKWNYEQLADTCRGAS